VVVGAERERPKYIGFRERVVGEDRGRMSGTDMLSVKHLYQAMPFMLFEPHTEYAIAVQLKD